MIAVRTRNIISIAKIGLSKNEYKHAPLLLGPMNYFAQLVHEFCSRSLRGLCIEMHVPTGPKTLPTFKPFPCWYCISRQIAHSLITKIRLQKETGLEEHSKKVIRKKLIIINLNYQFISIIVKRICYI